MRGRTPQPEAVLLFHRCLALILAWSLLLPAAPARPAPRPRPQPLLALVPAIPSLVAGDPSQASVVPEPQSDAKTSKCPPLPNDPDNFVPRDLGQSMHPHQRGDEWGEITVAQPKIWQFDRVSSLLDGLLRDVEGVSLSDLIQLNPNSQNAAAVRFVQSALEVGVQYDQAAAVNARNTLSNFQAQQGSQLQQLDAYNTYLQTLTTQRNNLASQLAAATNQVNTLQALQAAGTATPAQAAELLAAQASVQSLTSSLTATNSLISGAGAPPTLTAPPTLVGTSVSGPASGSTMSSSLNGFSQVLSSLPQGVQNNLSNALGSPTLPATKQLDNFITLLYERLAREVSVLQDDLMRDPENEAFLLQFDVGLYPSKRSSDHVARVEFNLQCPGCRIYSLYPGMSAYNIASYTGSSKRTTLWGNVLTLLGFGLSASYRRQVDTLQGGLVQSVYTAGFQNGVLNTGTPETGKLTSDKQRYSLDEHKIAGFATQSFGWYYGQAPTEKLVTPGIRSTFAVLTVPRKLIENNEDRFGNVNTCIAFKINGAWARRDNPTLQHSYVSALGDVAKVLSFPAYYPANNPLYNHDDEKSYVYKRASVKLPASADDVPLVARREYQKLHVVRMEYNTVYAPPPPPSSAPPPTSTTTSVSNSSTTTPPAPSTSTSTATSGTTTTTTTTTTTGSAPAATSTPAPAPAAPSYPNLNPLPCPPHECSAILVRLDRPIDPNLVVTVRGQPLQRVRDWRGRATSILPPAQSGSDLSSTASASGSIYINQLRTGRSLLESDSFEANSWFQLNARDLIINVSKSVATDYEFPTIQISEPKGTVLIPGDLQRSSAEIITNGFHLAPQTAESIGQSVSRNYGTDPDDSESPDDLTAHGNRSPLWGGPFTPATFQPLFAPDPAAKNFYAWVGQTGEDILIGFLPDRNGAAQMPAQRTSFLESHTQVILEDAELDFAWSLYCYVQGEELACHLPRQEITRAYQSYLEACENDPSRACPAIDEKYLALRLSFGRAVQRTVAGLDQVLGPAAKSEEEEKENNHAAWHAVAAYPRPTEILKHSFVSTMQLWLEQLDAEGPQSFYAAEPTKIDFLPLSSDFWQSEALPPSARKLPVRLGTRSISVSLFDPGSSQPGTFNPWHLESADHQGVKIEGCNYLPGSPATDIKYQILGTSVVSEAKALVPDSRDSSCGSFPISTPQLAKDQLVFEIKFPAVDLDGTPRQPEAVIHLATSRLKPSFGKPLIALKPAGRNGMACGETSSSTSTDRLVFDHWEVDIPVSRAVYGDALEFPVDLHSVGFCPEWRLGNAKHDLPGVYDPRDANSGLYSLHLEIHPKALAFLPSRLDLIRNYDVPNGGKAPIVVATLPDLHKLLLPSKLKLTTISDHQLALQGENAGRISAISVSIGGDKSQSQFKPVASSGNEFALATFDSAADKSSNDGSANTNGNTATGGSSSISVLDTAVSTQVTIAKQDKSTPAPKPPTTPATTTTPPTAPTKNKPADANPSDPSAAPTKLPDPTGGTPKPTPLNPGSYLVQTFITVGYKQPAPSKVAESKAAEADLEAKAQALDDAMLALNGAPHELKPAIEAETVRRKLVYEAAAASAAAATADVKAKKQALDAATAALNSSPADQKAAKQKDKDQKQADYNAAAAKEKAATAYAKNAKGAFDAAASAVNGATADQKAKQVDKDQKQAAYNAAAAKEKATAADAKTKKAALDAASAALSSAPPDQKAAKQKDKDTKQAASDVAAAQANAAAADAKTKKGLLDVATAALKTASDDQSTKKTDLQKKQTDYDAAVQKAKTAAEAATPSPIYMPLDVTDEKGGPLIFVVPEAKKPANTPPATTPTCTAPCAVPLCTITGCPPAPKPATTPAS